ncbi:MAG: site-specific DNA-methyltransferase [Candidatus Diapherotrites archaeon]|nr:site-specific DNA-methyltransferase [Candidatus Diapherotrites archaeon]
MTPEKLRPSFTFTEDRLRQLQQVVPEAFADGKINWEVLREALGNYLEDEEACEEHFGLFWPGKRQARRLAALPPKGTLVPAPGEGVNEDQTHHIFIEGENLEVLKLLQKSYAGRVKMIYIDPPYNTGKDFIYPDDYGEPLEAYLKRTGQMDEEGRRLTTNTKASGRFHSNWLNMMYPRLLLARQLLREDGVIFVSIDDNEVHNLRQLMNEVFGEENFVATIIWQKKFARQNDATYFSTMHDYILCFARISAETSKSLGWELNLLPRTEDANAGYSNPDNDPRGPWTSVVLSSKSGSDNLIYKIVTPGGRECWPPEGRYWSVTKEKFDELVADNRIWFGKNGKGIPRLKTFLSEVQSGLRPNTIWFHSEVSHNQGARQDLKRIFDGKAVFDNPKPVALVKQMVEIASGDTDGIFLDFFAGSCPLAHAVLQKNREDGGNRQFIVVQIPEPLDPKRKEHKAAIEFCDQMGKPRNIAEIGKERIRRVIAKMQAEREGQLEINPDEDLGFKVFKLQRSHFKEWQPVEPTTPQALDNLFSQHASPLVEGWEPQALLTEILLLEGFPLDSAIVSLDETFPANTVWRVHHPDVGHELFVCLDETLVEETVERLKAGDLLRDEDIFICLDAALTDEAKVVLDDRLRLKVI